MIKIFNNKLNLFNMFKYLYLNKSNKVNKKLFQTVDLNILEKEHNKNADEYKNEVEYLHCLKNKLTKEEKENTINLFANKNNSIDLKEYNNNIVTIKKTYDKYLQELNIKNEIYKLSLSTNFFKDKYIFKGETDFFKINKNITDIELKYINYPIDCLYFPKKIKNLKLHYDNRNIINPLQDLDNLEKLEYLETLEIYNYNNKFLKFPKSLLELTTDKEFNSYPPNLRKLELTLYARNINLDTIELPENIIELKINDCLLIDYDIKEFKKKYKFLKNLYISKYTSYNNDPELVKKYKEYGIDLIFF